jgi:uncharacterized protein (TIGR00288 family)
MQNGSVIKSKFNEKHSLFCVILIYDIGVLMKEDNKYVAVFIDAENISSRNAEQIFNEASNYGEIIVKRIFGDWSHNNLALSWKEAISKYSIKAEQQFSFVSGKNTSDISLIIQAMIALFEKDIDVFCLVSSDSDFTYLVQEMREREKVVVGMGARTSPQAFVNAFSEFIYLGEEAVKPLEVAEIEKDKKEIIKVKKINNGGLLRIYIIIEQGILLYGWLTYTKGGCIG